MTTSPELQTGITRDIYGMPAFVTLTVPDVRATAAWFTGSLDFIELFAMPPGDEPELIHLRRWRYQDILLRRGETAGEPVGDGIQLSFAAVYDELDDLAATARAAGAHLEGPYDTRWNTRDLTIVAPTGLRLVFTARRPEPLRDQAFNANMERWNASQRSS
jgi:hypothetical protein